MVRTLRDHVLQVLKTLTVVPGLDFDDAQERSGVMVLRVELKDERQFFPGPMGIAPEPQQLGQLEADVVELRTEPKGAPKLVHRILRAVEIEIGPGQRAVKIGDLAAAIGVVRRIRLALSALQGPCTRAVFAKLIASHREVERGLQVTGVDLERLLEAPTRFGQPAAEVIDDAKPIEHVGITKALLHEFLVVGLSKRVLGAIVVLVRGV